MGLVLNGEVNFLTEDDQMFGDNLCRVIKTEFDLIRSWQGMATTFGYEARTVLDNYIALSLRKLLCDKESLILKICPNFKMPPLDGNEFRCPGENDEMKLVEIHTNIRIKPEAEAACGGSLLGKRKDFPDCKREKTQCSWQGTAGEVY